jgi:hypothetical protein
VAREGGAGVVVTGVGVCSSLGDLATACAAARAGLSVPSELDFNVDEGDQEDAVPVVGHPVPDLESYRGRGRLIALAEQALADLAAQDPGLAKREGLGFLLCLTDPETRRFEPEPEPGRPPPEAPPSEREKFRAAAGARLDLAADIAALAGLPVDRAQLRVFASGATGLAAAVDSAVQVLEARQLTSCLIGCVDSQIDIPILQFLKDSGRLKGPNEPNGLMPGEAAVFLSLERSDVARHQGRPVLARLSATAMAQGIDPDTVDHPPRGTALLELFTRLVGGAGPPPAGSFWFLTDQNGELFRALEWADFVIRARERFPEVPQAPLWYPAVTFGDTGAASGALAVGMAVRAFARGYAPAPTAIVLSATYEGLRSAVQIDAPPARR